MAEYDIRRFMYLIYVVLLYACILCNLLVTPQATKALAKEARRVRTFMLQQAIRKSKSVGENAEAKKSKDAKKHGAMGAAGAGVVSATTTKDTSVDSAATSQEATGGGDEAKSREHAPGSDNDDDGGSGEDGGGGGGEDASDASDASGGGGEDASGDGGAGGGGAGKATLSSAAAAEDAPIPETPRDTAATRSAKEIATIKVRVMPPPSQYPWRFLSVNSLS